MVASRAARRASLGDRCELVSNGACMKTRLSNRLLGASLVCGGWILGCDSGCPENYTLKGEYCVALSSITQAAAATAGGGGATSASARSGDSEAAGTEIAGELASQRSDAAGAVDGATIAGSNAEASQGGPSASRMGNTPSPMETDKVCQPDPCQHGGRCRSETDTFSCDCTDTGYAGAICDIATVDCNVDHGGCHPLADCNSGNKSSPCTCPGTHVGDGIGPDGCRHALKEIYLDQATTCALTQDGEVSCWGADVLDSEQYSTRPNRISGLDDVAAFGRSGLTKHMCVVMHNGHVRCWGNNTMGQLGDGTRVNRASPVEVANLTGVSKVAVTESTSCAISNGSLYCWGSVPKSDNSGVSLTPVLTTSMSGLVDVSLGFSNTHCVVRNDGTSWCWGTNYAGHLGAPSPDPDSSIIFTEPTLVRVASDFVQVDIGANSTCGLLRDSTLRCWGMISGSTDQKVVARDVTRDVISYDLCFGILCTALANKTVQCRFVTNDQLQMSPTLQWDAVQVVTDGSSVCVLLRDSRVYCWGANSRGQLGDGTTTDSTTPVQVKDL